MRLGHQIEKEDRRHHSDGAMATVRKARSAFSITSGTSTSPPKTVTESGKWLADLRIDTASVSARLWKVGVFDELTTAQAAGLWPRSPPMQIEATAKCHATRTMNEILTDFEDLVVSVSNVEWKNGVSRPLKNKLLAAAPPNAGPPGWNGTNWSTEHVAEECDLVRLLSARAKL